MVGNLLHRGGENERKMTNSIQELQLIKRTAWVNANREPRGCTDEEAQRLTPHVVNAVVYTAALNGALYDLEEQMKAEHTMNDSAKKVLRLLHHKASYAHGEIYRVFSNAIEGFGELYNKRYDLTTRAIEEHVLLRGGEKYYNIVLALLRLVRKNNNACGRFRSPALLDLEPNERRLAELKLPYKDRGEVMEIIIDGASKEVIGMKEFKKVLK